MFGTYWYTCFKLLRLELKSQYFILGTNNYFEFSNSLNRKAVVGDIRACQIIVYIFEQYVARGLYLTYPLIERDSRLILIIIYIPLLASTELYIHDTALIIAVSTHIFRLLICTTIQIFYNYYSG